MDHNKVNTKMSKQRSFLKYAGNKYQLVEEIESALPPASKLIEPFTGSGSVFLNADNQRYLLNDVNQDLINTFLYLKTNATQFIKDLSKYFHESYNCAERYYELRHTFNLSTDCYLKSLIFVYMNRHGFQGLCRYNNSGYFNVPFGHYKKVYFPKDEMIAFSTKAKQAEFMCSHFSEAFRRARRGDIVFCDPPYYKLNKTANFTSYSAGGFSINDQIKLVELAEKARERGVVVVITNHDIKQTRALYKTADIANSIDVRRAINAKSALNRSVKEIMVSYIPKVSSI